MKIEGKNGTVIINMDGNVEVLKLIINEESIYIIKIDDQTFIRSESEIKNIKPALIEKISRALNTNEKLPKDVTAAIISAKKYGSKEAMDCLN